MTTPYPPLPAAARLEYFSDGFWRQEQQWNGVMAVTVRRLYTEDQMRAYLDADRAQHAEQTDALRRAVRTAWSTGLPDWRRHYDSELFALLGINHFQDLCDKTDSPTLQAAQAVGYLAAHELGRLNSGHDSNLRSAKFGPSALDGDVPVYLAAPPPAQDERAAQAVQMAIDALDPRAAFEAHIKAEYDCPQFVSNFWLLDKRGADYAHGTTFHAWYHWKAGYVVAIAALRALKETK